MKYNGKELKEITTPQIFAEPKKMLVWNDDYVEHNSVPMIDSVYAVVKVENHYVAVTWGHNMEHCAEIPKVRRATNRELSRWLAQGNGEMKAGSELAYTHMNYNLSRANSAADSTAKVRKWDDDAWHEPTVDYMFGESL